VHTSAVSALILLLQYFSKSKALSLFKVKFRSYVAGVEMLEVHAD